MAFRTRKVTIKALNDSKQIALLVYITTFELVVLAVIAFGLREWHIVYRAVFGGAMFIAATVYLSVVFIPRVSCSTRAHMNVSNTALVLEIVYA